MANTPQSPGIYSTEVDFSTITATIGITQLGMVGLTPKGPAFEPTVINSSSQFVQTFGGTNPNMFSTYFANDFLSQGSYLTVTRLLGSQGYTNSPAWVIQGSGGTYNNATLCVVRSKSSDQGTTFYANAASAFQICGAYGSQGAQIIGVGGGKTVNSLLNILPSSYFFNVSIDGGPPQLIFAYIPPGTTYGALITNTNTFYPIVGGILSLNSAGNLVITSNSTGPNSTVSITPYTLNSGQDLFSNLPAFTSYSAATVGTAGIVGTTSPFSISGSTGPLTAQSNSAITISLDETRNDYIVKVLGTNPISTTGDLGMYVESIYPHFIREAGSRGDITTILSAVTFSNNPSYTNYAVGWQAPITPYVVSQVVGGSVQNLFYFQSIADGAAGNTEIKVSIENIDITTNFFDVTVRDYYDTDANISILESYRQVTLDPTQLNYICSQIGTENGSYPQVSQYISLVMAPNVPTTGILPGGFGGYPLRNTGVSGATSPNIYYKTQYFSGDSVYKTYLGISELGYTAHTASVVAQSQAILSLEDDLWQYPGATVSGMTTIKGFHLETLAPSSTYVLGQYPYLSNYTKPQAKFTLAFYGGFDGWNQYRLPGFTSAAIDSQNLAQFKAGIDLMAAPESVSQNLFMTPDVDFYTNQVAVQYAVSMIQSRLDSLYIINAPRLLNGTTKGTAAQCVSALKSVNINSSYCATYFPWIQYNDQSNGNQQFVYMPPTGQVVMALAKIDNLYFSWSAPAGFQRGSVSPNVVRTDIRLTQSDRDTLSSANINSIATFSQQGIVIFAQDTLQIQNSLLNRINVRRLMLNAEALIKAAANTLLFEQNDTALRNQFTQKVQPILQNMQNQRGLFAFNVVVAPYNPAYPNTLSGQIQLQPIPAAEIISLTFSVNPQGVTFQ